MSLQFSNGDWATGIVFGITLPDLPWTARDVVAISVGYEYNLSPLWRHDLFED
jgi:hypothetical protein